MKLDFTFIDGLAVLECPRYADDRGYFQKTFHSSLNQFNRNIDFKESFYTTSSKSVIRGMHFQLQPFDLVKIVYIIKGEILDVCLDLRKNSLTHGKYFSINLSSQNNKGLLIPSGLAHGFKALSDDCIVGYHTSKIFSPDHDQGVHYTSFGFNWGEHNPILSQRDSFLPNFDVNKNYFKL
jgi:dTDP-4-dehydrorhamnose 3,5-epimerase